MHTYFITRLFLVILICGFAGCISNTQTLNTEEIRCLPMYRFLIPEGYVGWVKVDFNYKDAPFLPAEGDYLVFKIPPSGYLKTPARRSCGYPADFYYSGESRKQLVEGKTVRWRGYPSEDAPDFRTEYNPKFDKEIADYFFVGTEQEFEKYKDSTYKTQGEIKYGNLNDSNQQ